MPWIELAKLAIAPAFVAIVTLVGRRFGPSVAGFLAALPVVGGPILVLITVARGPAYGSVAALSCAIGTGPTIVFALAYARFAQRLAPAACLVAAYAVYFGVASLAYFAPVTWPFGIAVPLASWLVCLRAFPVHPVELPRMAAPRWDLPMRVTLTFVMVAAITGLAHVVGPNIAGLITPIPIITATLAAFSHQLGGAATAATLLRALVRGIASFVTFFWVAAALLPHVQLWAAFAGALASCITMHWLLQRFDVAAPKPKG